MRSRIIWIFGSLALLLLLLTAIVVFYLTSSRFNVLATSSMTASPVGSQPQSGEFSRDATQYQIEQAYNEYVRTEKGKRRGQNFGRLAFLLSVLPVHGIHPTESEIKRYLGQPDRVLGNNSRLAKFYYFDDPSHNSSVAIADFVNGKLNDMGNSATTEVLLDGVPATVPTTANDDEP